MDGESQAPTLAILKRSRSTFVTRKDGPIAHLALASPLLRTAQIPAGRSKCQLAQQFESVEDLGQWNRAACPQHWTT